MITHVLITETPYNGPKEFKTINDVYDKVEDIHDTWHVDSFEEAWNDPNRIYELNTAFDEGYLYFINIEEKWL